MTRKLDKEDYEEIQNFQKEFATCCNVLGSITAEEHVINQQLTQLIAEKNNYLNTFLQLKEQEDKIVSKLKEKYGDGEIDINAGTFTSL